jgi:DNA-binding NarL/FixJ family response regulator
VLEGQIQHSILSLYKNSSMKSNIKIMQVDDPVSFRQAISIFLNLEDTIHLGKAVDGTGALKIVTLHWPKVVLIDLRMRHLHEPTAPLRIAYSIPEPEILVLTTMDREAEIFDALRAGTNGTLGPSGQCSSR